MELDAHYHIIIVAVVADDNTGVHVLFFWGWWWRNGGGQCHHHGHYKMDISSCFPWGINCWYMAVWGTSTNAFCNSSTLWLQHQSSADKKSFPMILFANADFFFPANWDWQWLFTGVNGNKYLHKPLQWLLPKLWKPGYRPSVCMVHKWLMLPHNAESEKKKKKKQNQSCVLTHKRKATCIIPTNTDLYIIWAPVFTHTHCVILNKQTCNSLLGTGSQNCDKYMPRLMDRNHIEQKLPTLST